MSDLDPATAHEIMQQVTNPKADQLERHSVDAVVIGLGGAGEQIASRLADAGWDVIGFEPERVGGECPFIACVPSKSLLHDALSTERTWGEAVSRRKELTHHLDDAIHADELTDSGVMLIRESASIVGERTVRSEHHEVTADHVIIATGSAPFRPPIDGIDLPQVWWSEDALTSDELPARLVIIGGGAIGSELSQVYAANGSQVTVLEAASQLLVDAEPAVSEVLADALRDAGVTVRLDAEVEAITPEAAGVSIHLAAGDEVGADRVLIATGVTPRLDGIGLDALGLVPDDLRIDDCGRVADLSWLWAAGDVTPQSAWTHGATYQSRALIDRLLDKAWIEAPLIMPRCVFTDPPLGVVGDTLATAQEKGVDAFIGQASYRDTVRSKTDEIEHGVAAIVVDRSSDRIIGASIAGPRADDLIQIITAFMASSATLETAHRTVFPFPTLGQVIELAIDDAVTQR